MASAPMNLTNDMALIEQHWEEGQRLQRCGCFTAEEWSQHQAISYSALMVLGIDGMQQLGHRCVMEGAAELV